MNSQEKSQFNKWVRSSGLSPDLQNIAIGVGETLTMATTIVGGITTIIGIVDFFSKAVEFLVGKDQRPNPFQMLLETVQRIETTLASVFKWNENAEWNKVLADQSAASQMLQDFINRTIVSSGNRPELLTDTARDQLFNEVIQPMRRVRLTLLPPPESGPPAFQQAIDTRIAFDFAYNGWAILLAEHDKEERIPAAALGITGLPDDNFPIAWRGSTSHTPSGQALGDLIWDYRRALPHILRTLTELVSAMKVYDPAFRTTQRFQEEIEKILRDLDIFAARWFKCLAWTKNLPLDPESPDSDFPEGQVPLAYDSRARLFVSYASEHPEVNYWRPCPPEPEFSQKRMEYARKLLVYSGFNDFRAWVDQLRRLTALPEVSESLTSESRISGFRRFRGKSTEQVPGIVLTVKRHHVDWLVTIDLKLQPQRPPYDYARNLAIRYEYFVESYQRDGVGGDPPQGLIQRHRLLLGEHRLAMRVLSPEVWVAAEDDGSFGTEPGTVFSPGPGLNLPSSRGIAFDSDVEFTLPQEPQSKLTALPGKLRDIGALLGRDPVEPVDPKTSNRILAKMAVHASALDQFMTTEIPPRAHWTGGKPATTEFTYVLNDRHDGQATFRAWSLPDQPNAGSLYLVIEEIPPRQPGVRIRTMLPVYLNPEEIWYPGFSRTRPGAFVTP